MRYETSEYSLPPSFLPKVELFGSITRNGYRILYLSARAIGQVCVQPHTSTKSVLIITRLLASHCSTQIMCRLVILRTSFVTSSVGPAPSLMAPSCSLHSHFTLLSKSELRRLSVNLAVWQISNIHVPGFHTGLLIRVCVGGRSLRFSVRERLCPKRPTR